MTKIVTVKFKPGGKSYYFAPGKDTYEKGMGVIVETAKGLEYATVVVPDGEVDESRIVSPLKPIVRVATKKDEEQVKRNRERVGEALQLAEQKIAERGLEMKLVDCEFAFDGSKVVFYFTAESRVDFRELIKDLSSAFHSRIELRQINIREEIKMTGGLGMCGRECCCINCMKEPLKVSVKMAKNQGLSLNPSKISGLCGRLMCCLSYENDYYSEACKQVPKVGSEIDTPDGRGMVVNVNMLKMTVKVKIEKNDSVSYQDFTVDELRTGKRAPKEEEEKRQAEIILSEITGGEQEDGQSPAEQQDGNSPHDGAQGEGRGKRRRDRGRGKKGGEPRGENAEKAQQGGERRQGDNGERKQNKNGKHKNKGNQPPQEKGGQSAPNSQSGKQESGKQGGQKKKHKHNGNNQNNQNNQNKQNNQNNQNSQNDNGEHSGGHRSGKRRHRRHGGNGGQGNPQGGNNG